MKCQAVITLTRINARTIESGNYIVKLYEHITIKIHRSWSGRMAKCYKVRSIREDYVASGLHKDIYLLVLMVACRHRHASIKVVGVQRDFQERLPACCPFPPF